MPTEDAAAPDPAASSGEAGRLGFSEELWTRLRLHISNTWSDLSRDLKHAVQAAADPKTDGTVACLPIYVSSSENAGEISARLEKILPATEFSCVQVVPLSTAPEHITDHGLLYLPGRYVAPGGRFNELYGWDSFFIALGLLRDGRVGLARSVADQCLYEVEHYGVVLNCNREPSSFSWTAKVG